MTITLVLACQESGVVGVMGVKGELRGDKEG